MIFDDRVKELLDGRSFAVLATLNPDGTPQTSVIWVARDGDALIFTTHDRRRKARNLRRDPRASVTVFPPDDPYRTANIRGTVELIDNPDRTLSVTLTRRNLGQDPPADPTGFEPAHRPPHSGIHQWVLGLTGVQPLATRRAQGARAVRRGGC
jgi:PPOX class probable F420-dependent enzyme